MGKLFGLVGRHKHKRPWREGGESESVVRGVMTEARGEEGTTIQGMLVASRSSRQGSGFSPSASRRKAAMHHLLVIFPVCGIPQTTQPHVLLLQTTHSLFRSEKPSVSGAHFMALMKESQAEK